MAWTGTGSYVLNALYYPEVNGTIIDAVRYNGLLADVQGGITAALAKNGENVPTANLPMGGFKHTGVASAVGAGQYIAWGQNATLGAVTFTDDISGVSASFSGGVTATENLLGAKVIATTDGVLGSAIYGFGSESGLGMYRVASNKLGFQVVGTKRLELNTSGADITGTLGVSGTVTAPTFSGALSGNATTATTATTATSVSNALTFSNAGSGAASGTTYNGSAARTISYNSVGAAASTHTHAIGDITNVAAGTYTPTLGGNGTATVGEARYIRIGNIVHVSFRGTHSPTNGTGNNTNLTISLPIASALTDTNQVTGNGIATFSATGFHNMIVWGDVANDRAVVYWIQGSNVPYDVDIVFTYRII